MIYPKGNNGYSVTATITVGTSLHDEKVLTAMSIVSAQRIRATCRYNRKRFAQELLKRAAIGGQTK